MTTKKQNPTTAEIMLGFALIGAVVGLALCANPQGKQTCTKIKTDLLAILEKYPSCQEIIEAKKVKDKDDELAKLKEDMHKCVADEKYEEAARLRDQIKALKQA